MQAGDTFTHPYRVSEDVYRGFISTFSDTNPLHTDVAFARSKGFASEVMHGNILNGFVSHYIGECLPFKNVIIHSQEIKFALPVYLDDELTLSITVEDVYESVHTIAFKFHFENTAGKKVARGKIQIGLI